MCPLGQGNGFVETRRLDSSQGTVKMRMSRCIMCLIGSKLTFGIRICEIGLWRDCRVFECQHCLDQAGQTRGTL